MPFTFSHPAIVLPFSKLRSPYLSISCLIIGSITPDFEYFLTMKATGRYSHTLEGAFAMDLPIALVLAFIFHLLVKDPLISNLPGYFNSRLIDLRDFNFMKNFKSFSPGYLVCLLIGIFSHIGWDSFTHANEYFVERLDVLSTPIVFGALPSWPLFRYLQHLSTIAGFLTIAVVFHNRVSSTNEFHIANSAYWIRVFIVAIIVFLIRWSFTFEYFADVATSIISSLLAGIIVTSFIVKLRTG